MQLNPYYHIKIINDQFTLMETLLRLKTKNYALETLEKIAHILTHNLTYAPSLPKDPYQGLFRDQKKIQLKVIADKIFDHYQNKLRGQDNTLSPCKLRWMKFFGLARREKKIQQIYHKILMLSELSLVDLPNELIKNILDYLPLKDIAPISQTNSQLNPHGQSETITKMQMIGYKGHSLEEAKNFYKKRLNLIKKIVIQHQQNPLLFPLIAFKKDKIDFHQTFQNIWKKHLDRPGCFKNFTDSLFYDSIKKKDLESVEFLLELGANPNLIYNRVYEQIPMLTLAYEKSFPIFKKLLEAGANPNCYSRIGTTLLFDACRSSRKIEYVEALLKHKANVNLKNRNGEEETPIFAAIEYPNLPIIRLLFKHGANLNFRNKNHSTPLHEACFARVFFDGLKGYKKKKEIVKFLLENGARARYNHYHIQPYSYSRSRKIRQLLRVHGQVLQ